ncbi:hypothetical protein CH267_12850 [Rhodococcus sp. 06-621-2]|nr:LacI family DNA-binding transcriptional regulator [Rhodococcus sp. 06-621-2]OZC55463.1 hypothetical protein CH267_12850 [Rhodococcus sp. 06-621-2]
MSSAGLGGSDRRRIPTQGQIAAEVGTTTATVSRVLAKPESHARTELARRVWSTAKRLDYRPNSVASGLRTRKAQVVGVTLPHMRDEVFGLFYEGIEMGLAAAGYQAITVTTNDDPATQIDKAELLIRRRVDGVLVGDAVEGGAALALLRRSGMPLVLYNRPARGYTGVTCDDYAGGRMAADHLIQSTDGPLAVYSGMAHARNLALRTQGFLDAAAEAGRAVDPRLVVAGPILAEAGRIAVSTLRELLDGSRIPGVFLVNDMAAISFVGACEGAGLTAGKDLHVVGFNDIAISSMVRPALTTIASPVTDIGRLAAETLVAKIEGRRVGSRSLMPHLVVRSSAPGPKRSR